MDYRVINPTIAAALATCLFFAHEAFCGQRVDELEAICIVLPDCDLDNQEPEHTPDEIISKYGVTTNAIAADLKLIASRYGTGETNELLRIARISAIGWLGDYGSTNDLEYLAVVATNSADYAQQSAVGAGIVILRHSPRLIPYARDIVTNGCLYSVGLRRWVQSQLLGMCEEGKSDNYIDDPAQHARIAAFFLELADMRVYEDDYLFVDRCAYTLNPTYRHSQRRRDNLAAARPSGLTGLPAGIYDARQRDAVQNE